MLTPFERYQNALACGDYYPDSQQLDIINYFQELYNHIEHKKYKTKGLYLWGSVGTGKTWMMDLFFDSLSTKQKKRIHFHEFMKEIHDKLNLYQGQKDPLVKIAKELAKKIQILCFDEFFVSDITDAMILSELLQALFKQGLIIIMTSNIIPDDLYKNGLQRQRFLPAITFIKKNMDILALNITQDYRLRELKASGLFFTGTPDHNHPKINHLFNQLSHGEVKTHKDIYLYERPISTVMYSDNIIWVNFKKICATPRSQLDYLSLAKRWKIIIIDNITIIPKANINTVRYFINLIDILYDHKNIVILGSEIPIDKIYTEGELAFDFKRTISRLTEMQSTAYLQISETIKK